MEFFRLLCKQFLSEGRGEQKNISLYYKQKHNHLLDMCIYNEALHCSVRS